MRSANPIDFNLWRVLLDEHADELLETRRWAVNLHETFLMLFNGISAHLAGVKEIEVHYEKKKSTAGIRLVLGMEDGTFVPFLDSGLAHLEENDALLARARDLMQQEPDKHLQHNMNSKLVFAMDSWASSDCGALMGVFRPSMTLEKTQDMLGNAYPHWLALIECANITQNTAAAKSSVNSSRRM